MSEVAFYQAMMRGNADAMTRQLHRFEGYRPLPCATEVLQDLYRKRDDVRAKLLDEATRRAIAELPHLSRRAMFQYRGQWYPHLLPVRVREHYRDLAERFPAA